MAKSLYCARVSLLVREIVIVLGRGEGSFKGKRMYLGAKLFLDFVRFMEYILSFGSWQAQFCPRKRGGDTDLGLIQNYEVWYIANERSSPTELRIWLRCLLLMSGYWSFTVPETACLTLRSAVRLL